MQPHFTPPYPERPPARLPLHRTLLKARRSFLDVWLAPHFEEEVIATKILAQHILVCNSPGTVQQAFIGEARALERKSPQMRHALEPLIGDGLFISDGLVWKQRRPVVAEVTHTSRLAALAPVMTEVAAEARAVWDAQPADRPLDVLGFMGWLAAEVICRTLFGRTLGSEAARTVVEAFARYQGCISHLDWPSVLGLPDWVPRPHGRVTQEVQRIHTVVDALVAGALADPAPSLIRAMAEAGGLDATALRNEAATLFMAGHETTANALAWCCYLLSQAPAAEARLAEEAAALDGRAATWDDLPRLPYTRAVVEEALRLYPPVPLLARQAQQPLEIAGRAVPKGGIVMVVPWLLHRHRLVWQHPDGFLPERFLPGAPPIPRHAYVPFSLGPRVCTGMGFGLTEATIVLATLLARHRVTLAPEARVWPVCRLTLRPGAALPMLVTRRG